MSDFAMYVVPRTASKSTHKATSIKAKGMAFVNPQPSNHNEELHPQRDNRGSQSTFEIFKNQPSELGPFHSNVPCFASTSEFRPCNLTKLTQRRLISAAPLHNVGLGLEEHFDGLR